MAQHAGVDQPRPTNDRSASGAHQLARAHELSITVCGRRPDQVRARAADEGPVQHDRGILRLARVEHEPRARRDALVLPRGSPHVLRDATGSEAPPLAFDHDGCPRVLTGDAARLGGSGPVTALIAGQFTFGAAHRNALLDSLPPAIHLPAAAAASPQLAGVVPLILSESASPSPGSGIALARLADLLLLHALRHWMAAAGHSSCGLREGDASVAAVATQVGDANAVAFTKAFSRLQGVGPGAFRRVR